MELFRYCTNIKGKNFLASLIIEISP